MDVDWQFLCDAGVPLGGTHHREVMDAAAVARAAAEGLAAAPDPVSAEALGAFVRAWAQHWPVSFAAAFGVEADRCLARAVNAQTTRDRYLKLRRIAMTHLARWA